MDSALDSAVDSTVSKLRARRRRPERPDDEGIRKARLVSTSGAALALATFLLGTARFALEGMNSRLGLVIMSCSLVFLLVPLVLRVTRWVGFAGSLIPLGGLFCLAAMATVDSGLLSEALYWAPFIPLAAMLMAPRRVVYLVTVLGLLLYPYLLLAHLWGGNLEVPSYPTDFLVLHALAGMTAFLFGALLGLIYERTRELAHRRLWTLANHHELTGLPNRGRFRELLGSALDRMRRSSSTVGLLLLDLDNFKEVNDSLGHDSGDAVLRSVAARLDQVCDEGEQPCHLAGDEFTVILELEDEESEERARETAERIRATLAEPIDVHGIRVPIAASIGVAVAHNKESVDDLMKRADLAMYSAKREARNEL